MIRLIHTEFLKQRTQRTFVAAVIAAPLVAALITVVVLGAAGHQGNSPLGPDSLVDALGAPANVVTVIALVLGILGMAGEYRHETITTTVLATPRRRDIVMSKLVAHSLTGALIGLLSVAISTALALPWLHAENVSARVDADLLRVAVGVIGSSALHGALGVAVGGLIRNQTAAIAAVLVWLLAVEGVISDVLGSPGFVHWLPVAAAHAIVRPGSSTTGLSAAIGASVFFGYVAVLAIAATRTTLRRDVT